MSIEANSPAQRAGLREGDVIISLADQSVSGVDDLHRILSDVRPAAKTTVTIIRSTEKIKIAIIPTAAEQTN